MDVIANLDTHIRAALGTLAAELSSGTWKGRREREVVSLFCFGHLIQQCRQGSALHDPAQIAIEVPIPQISEQSELSGRSRSKQQVCKDIVIWPQPRMVCWDGAGKPAVCPSAVIEWKHNQAEISRFDLDWLCAISSQVDSFVGYAVSSNHPKGPFVLSCTRIYRGTLEDKWLHISRG